MISDVKKEDHLEISEGPNKIASSAKCPLNMAPSEQLFINNKFELVVCCFIYYESGHGKTEEFCCPGFYGAIYSEDKGFQIDCRI